MLSGKIIKLIVYEVVQFACLSVPVFVVMERFASLMHNVKLGDKTAYWLVVAASMAYVTSVTLLVWVPLKYLILKSSRFLSEITNWRPVTLAYVILSTLPCFAILIAGSKVQVDANEMLEQFTELPVSLVLFCLICVDIVERIRPCRLTGQADGFEQDFEMPMPVLTHLEQGSTVSGQLHDDSGQNGYVARSESKNGTPAGHWRDSDAYSSRTSRTVYLYSSHSRSGPLSFLWGRDPRHELFVDSFLFWFDTAEVLRVAGNSTVFYSGWVFPVYILTYVSALRLVVTPPSPLLSTLGVLLQDFPFLVLRICLTVVFGYVTPLLYIMKNLLVCLTFLYFIFMTKLKVFNRGSMF